MYNFDSSAPWIIESYQLQLLLDFNILATILNIIAGSFIRWEVCFLSSSVRMYGSWYKCENQNFVAVTFDICSSWWWFVLGWSKIPIFGHNSPFQNLFFGISKFINCIKTVLQFFLSSFKVFKVVPAAGAYTPFVEFSYCAFQIFQLDWSLYYARNIFRVVVL